MSDQYDGPALAAQIIRLQREIERLRAELAAVDELAMLTEAVSPMSPTRSARQVIQEIISYHQLAERAEANERLHEVREIYAGMDGFCADTAPEAYLQRIVRQMYEAAKEKKE